jgi:hypothetical protein
MKQIFEELVESTERLAESAEKLEKITLEYDFETLQKVLHISRKSLEKELTNLKTVL